MLLFGGGENYEFLGKNSTFDLSNHAGYKNFTVDNFIVSDDTKFSWSHYGTPGGNVYASINHYIIKEYNASTGILNIKIRSYGGAHGTDFDNTGAASRNVYLIS